MSGSSVDPPYGEAVLGTLTDAERAALAAWLREQGVEPHRRGMAPRTWVPVMPPAPDERLEAPLAPGVKPVYLLPPTLLGAEPGRPLAPGRLFPVTESQAAFGYRLRRERAARAALGIATRGDDVPEALATARNATAGSCVTAPWGEILAFDDGAAGLVWADIDPDDRRRHPTGATMRAVMWSMRRPWAYGALSAAALPAGSPTGDRGSRG